MPQVSRQRRNKGRVDHVPGFPGRSGSFSRDFVDMGHALLPYSSRIPVVYVRTGTLGFLQALLMFRIISLIMNW